MEVIRIVMIGITGMLLGLLLKGTRPEYTVYLSLGAGICIFCDFVKNAGSGLCGSVFFRTLQGCRLQCSGFPD